MKVLKNLPLAFLGGTCAGKDYRQELIPMLHKGLAVFNPVVQSWTTTAQLREEEAKAKSRLHVYVITPAMTGVFSIAEAVNSAHRGAHVFFCVLPEYGEDSFSESQLKSLEAVSRLIINVAQDRANISASLTDLAEQLNQMVA